jgi:hypothetical protein
MTNSSEGLWRRVDIAGYNGWWIYSLSQEIVLRLESSSASNPKSWRYELDLADGSLAGKEKVRLELAAAMYPIDGDIRLWVEDTSGRPLEGKKRGPGEPQEFPRREWTFVENTEDDGRSVVILPDLRRTLVHTIQLRRNDSGVADTMDIKATWWPPTIFFCGNNKVVGLHLSSLSDEFLAALMAKADKAADEFKQYERCGYFYWSSTTP